MRICVYGAGAVGGNLAARLAQGGIDVTVVARGPHAAAMRADGLTLVAGGERVTVRPRVAADAAEAGPQDAWILSLKAHGLAAVAPGLAPLLGADTPVVFATNGIPWWYGFGDTGALAGRRFPALDPDGVLERSVGADRAVGCVVYSGNAVASAGVVHNDSAPRNRFVVGRPDGASTSTLAALAETLRRGVGLDVPTVADIRRVVWEKLMANVSSAPLSSLTGHTTDGVVSDPALLALKAGVLAEGMAVAAAAGWPVAPATTAPILKPHGTAHKPSMLQDVEAGRPIEYDAIVGSVLAISRDLGVPTPTLDVIAPPGGARGGRAAR
ncbi:MAG: ketopantoate reductase family protein [Rhodospirillales bacterium]